MEFIILGLLLLKPLTSYEIRNFVKHNLSMICSDSAGSIHTALSKLVNEGHISFFKQEENGKNKKVYTITDSGSVYFSTWLSKPMEPLKTKKMELSKLFFLGMADKNERIKAIKNYIEKLREIHQYLIDLNDHFSQIIKSTKNTAGKADLNYILTYQGLTLQYGIDSSEFEIEWFKKLLKNMEG